MPRSSPGPGLGRVHCHPPCQIQYFLICKNESIANQLVSSLFGGFNPVIKVQVIVSKKNKDQYE